MKLKKIFLLLYCFTLSTITVAQTFKLAFNSAKQKPVSIQVSISDFAFYGKRDTLINLQTAEHLFSIPWQQPQYIRLTVNWNEKEKTSVQFMATTENYNIIADSTLKLSFHTNASNDFQVKYIHSENQKNELLKEQRYLLSQIDFSKSVKVAEAKIDQVKDSVAMLIDRNNKNNYEGNLDNLFGLYSLCQYSEYPLSNLRLTSIPDSIDILLKRLNREIQNSPVGLALKKKLDFAKKQVIGRDFQYDISLLDTLDSVIPFSTFKNKYLFVDFWATWCVPCLAETPYHLQAYHKYKGKNFQIVSISLDDRKAKESWLEMINRYKMNGWMQLSDYDRAASIKYNVRFIPANILINPNGVIIAKNLRAEQLLEKLRELFQH
jgi:thiol-disulfide isomerase/thioredoxin